MVKQPEKRTPGRGGRRGGGAARPNMEQRIVKAALAAFAREGWRRTTLSDIAAEAGVGLAEVYGHFASKQAVLAGFVRMIDHQVLARLDPDLAEEPARDRLFDVLMRRFDSLAPYKDGVRAVADELPWDAPAALAGVPRFLGSMAWMLEAAHIPGSGLLGALRVQGLGVVWATAMRTWLADDSPDKAPTMAALDRALRNAERANGLAVGLCRCCCALVPRRRPAGAPQAEETASA